MIEEEILSTQNIIITDFDILFRLQKAIEDNYLELNQVVSKIIHNRSQIEENIFINDLINQYKQLTQYHKIKVEGYFEQQKEVLRKHPQILVFSEKVNMYLKRACFRIFEVIFSSVNQTNHKAANLYQRFLKFKLQCQKALAEKSEDRSYRLIRLISQFSHEKYSSLIIIIQNITDHLQNGRIDEIDKLTDIGVTTKKIQNQNRDIETKKNNQNINKESGKLQIKLFEKRQSIKDDKKIFDRVFAHKKGRKVMDCYKDVMEINRQDFIDDFINCCQQDKQKTVQELNNRNSKNNKIISEFIDRKLRKRRRKLSQIPINIGEKQSFNSSKKNITKTAQSSSDDTKKSLLLKFKDNQYRERTLTQNFYKKNTKAEIKIRSNYRKNIINQHYSDRDKQSMIIKAIEDIICQNEELQLKVVDKDQNEEKLPFLNKRAYSVDKNYKEVEYQLSRVSINKNISASVKDGSSRIKRNKFERSEFLTSSKLKNSKGIVFKQFNHKIVRINDLNNQVLF